MVVAAPGSTLACNPLDKNGAVVAQGKGIREFIVGTGGESLYGRTPVAGRSEAFADDTYRIMELGLQASCRPKTG